MTDATGGGKHAAVELAPSGFTPEVDQLLARAIDLTADLFDVLTKLRPDPVPEYLLEAQKRALLDTVEALDDGDPEPVQLVPGEA